MREIITDWTTPAGGGFVSVMYFDPTILVETQRAALGSLWSAIDAGMPPSVSWVVRTEGRVLSSETGTLTGQWTEGTVYQDSGDATGTQPLPDAVQGLIRWRTDSVVRGRFHLHADDHQRRGLRLPGRLRSADLEPAHAA